jgi:hypothetical protein
MLNPLAVGRLAAWRLPAELPVGAVGSVHGHSLCVPLDIVLALVGHRQAGAPASRLFRRLRAPAALLAREHLGTPSSHTTGEGPLWSAPDSRFGTANVLAG